MKFSEAKKVINHARDHVAYRWCPCLPVRHDRRDWTPEEMALYEKAYRREKDGGKKRIRLGQRLWAMV